MHLKAQAWPEAVQDARVNETTNPQQQISEIDGRANP